MTDLSDESFPGVLPEPGIPALVQNPCRCCDRVHRLLADLATRTASHDRVARAYRATGDEGRERLAEKQEAIACVLRQVRQQLAYALRTDDATQPDPAGVPGVSDDEVAAMLETLGRGGEQ